MPTQQQIDAALKAGATMEQINQEVATPGSVKRADYMGAPQYEQLVDGKFASARTSPIQTTGQVRSEYDKNSAKLDSLATQ